MRIRDRLSPDSRGCEPIWPSPGIRGDEVRAPNDCRKATDCLVFGAGTRSFAFVTTRPLDLRSVGFGQTPFHAAAGLFAAASSVANRRGIDGALRRSHCQRLRI